MAGDEEENIDADDFDDEFQIKSRHDETEKQHDVNHVVISSNDMEKYINEKSCYATFFFSLAPVNELDFILLNKNQSIRNL